MRTLAIDIETYSSVDLTKCGVYRYTEAPDFEILLFGFAYDDELVEVCSADHLPQKILSDLVNPDILKTAYNANFERTCIAKHFGIECDPRQWSCTQVWALTLGLPGHLAEVAKVLKLEAQKDTRGKNLIKYFSIPCKPTKANEGRTRNLPGHDTDKWGTFIEYCRQDVEVEREIRRKLTRFPVTEKEQNLWILDQEINDRGVGLDPAAFTAAIACNDQYVDRLTQEAKELTGLDNPNSLTQIKDWLKKNGLETPDGMGKDLMPGLIDAAPNDKVRRVLELRQGMSKTSVDKYNAMDRSICTDGRARGLLKFYGANRTGRWTGSLIQVQNLPQNKVKDLDLARETLLEADFDWFEMLYGSPPFILSQLIRTAFVPAEGCRFIISDFSAIEARVVAWLAGEKWVLDVFRDHGKIYEATAAQMFKVPIDTIAKGQPNYDLRAKGKVGVLACGYGGGPAALVKMGALTGGIPEGELPRLVKQWRNANKNIVQYWYAAEAAAIKAIREKTTVPLSHGVRYRYAAGILFADLPSGRSLAYCKPRIKYDPDHDKDGIIFDGMDQIKKKWVSGRTYGGRLVENLTQAVARDCLAESMLRLDAAGYKIVMHVHDEVVIEEPRDSGRGIDDVTEIMSQPIEWAPGLPLAAAGFESEFYRKD